MMRGTMMTDKALKVAAAPKKKKRRGLNLNRKRAMMGYLFVLPFIIGLITFFLVPLIQSFIFSINKLEVVEGGYNLLPVGLSNYNRALRVHATYARDLVESVLYMLANVPLIIIFSFFAANLLNQKFKGRSLARAIFFLPVILTSGVMLVIDSGDLLQSSLGMTQTDGQEGVQSSGTGKAAVEIRLSPTFIDYIISAVDRIYEIVSPPACKYLCSWLDFNQYRLHCSRLQILKERQAGRISGRSLSRW